MPSLQKKTGSTTKRSAPSAPKKQTAKDKRQSKTAPVLRDSKGKDGKGVPEAKKSTVAKRADPPKEAKPTTAKPKAMSKKSKSLDKPKPSAKPPAPATKSVGRQQPKTAAVPSTHSKTPSKVVAKTGQKGAITGDTNAGLVVAYGSALRAKSVGPGGLLTARYHRSSGSPAGEAIASPYGDVRTMVCDVSPVPSDVESIDFSNASKPPPDRRGLFGRSQQTLRVGHHDKKPHTAKGMRHSDSHPGEAPKSCKTDKAEDSGEDATVQAASDVEATAVKNEIAVRIVPDSARQKLAAVSAKEATNAHSKAHVKETGKQKVNAATTKAPQPGASKTPNPKGQTSNGKPLKGAKPAKAEKLQLTRKPKAATDNGSNEKVAADAASDDDDKAKETASDTAEEQRPSRSNDIRNDSSNPEKDRVIKTAERPLTIRIKADEECCKAYAILNSKGIRVSLHTLRRALLTPTEYRMLQNAGQITDN